MRKSNITVLTVILLSFILGVCFYPQMPDKMVSHWNFQGEPDGYMSKFWALFLMPFVSLGLFLLFMVIPRIDPLKANIEKFRKYFESLIILVILFLFYIYLLSIFWNLGLRFDMRRVIAPALGVVFYYCGILIENTKRNWCIGIRTPWTLSSDKVWEKTHKLGGRLFKFAGMVSFLGIVLPQYTLFFVLVPIILIVICTVVYSYFEYRISE
ncbi:SdpI family protein [bacterium]|nr:SdpI family protein [bacterium]